MTSVQEIQVYPKVERRKFFRVELTDRIDCTAIPVSINGKKVEKEEYIYFQFLNISGGGAKLSSSIKFSLLDEVLFNLSFDFNNEHFSFLGNIRWEKQTKQEFLYGIEFINASKADESRIIRCLNNYEVNKVNAQTKVNFIESSSKRLIEIIALPVWLKTIIQKPIYLVIFFSILMFLSEFLIMFLFPDISEYGNGILDPILLIAILSPALYLLLLRPMKLYFLKRTEAEARLIKLNRDLEEIVAERTAELIKLNQLIRKEYAETLALSEEKYKNVVENLGVGVMVLGTNMEILTINNKIRQWYPSYSGTFKVDCHDCSLNETLNDGKMRESTVKREIGGNIRQLREISSPIRNSDGKIVGLTAVIEDITERRQWEETLRASEEKFRQLFNQISDIIIVHGLDNNLPSKIIEVNDFSCKKLGFSKEEFSSMTPMDLIPPELLNIDQIRSLFAKLKGAGVIGYESTFLTKQGDRIKVEVSSIGFFLNHKLAIITLCHDITKRKEMETQSKLLNESLEERVNQRTAELANAEKRYRSLVQQSSEGIFVIDTDSYTIQEANSQFLSLVGYSEDEIVGMSYLEIVVAERSEVEKHLELIKNQDQTIFVTRKYKRKDGSFFIVDVSASLIYYDDTEVILLNVREITERIQAEKALKQSYINLKHTLEETVNALVSMLQKRDPYSAGHMERVAKLSNAIAKEIGLPEKQAEAVLIAGMLHDIGKIYVPTDILNKPGKLTDNEMGIIKAHSQMGYEIIERIPFEYPIAEIILQHHERLNGTGYPKGLVGDDMLLEAKILAVADVVEAMASHRPYRPAMGLDLALEEVEKNKGLLYDPEVVEACLRLFQSGYQMEQGVRNIA